MKMCSLAAAVTAGVIESEIGAKNTCDVQRYYSDASAYRPIADAIKRRMEVPTTVRGHVFSKANIIG
jgi:hypothetical protein